MERSVSRLVLALAVTLVLLAAYPATGLAACANPVACENEKAGSAPGAWQVAGAGDSTIQGYATTMSVDRGQTIRFKVKTTASAYHIDVYRLGYYQGNGARLVTTLLHAMKDQNKKRGLATLCIGGGEALAVVVER